MKALILEDEGTPYNIIVKALEELGIEHEWFINIEDAKNRINNMEEDLFDFAILDIKIVNSIETGIDFAIFLKEKTTIPFFFVSQHYDREDHKKQLLEFGWVDKLVPKSMSKDIDLFTAKIENLLEKQLVSDLSNQAYLSGRIGICIEKKPTRKYQFFKVNKIAYIKQDIEVIDNSLLYLTNHREPKIIGTRLSRIVNQLRVFPEMLPLSNKLIINTSLISTLESNLLKFVPDSKSEIRRSVNLEPKEKRSLRGCGLILDPRPDRH